MRRGGKRCCLFATNCPSWIFSFDGGRDGIFVARGVFDRRVFAKNRAKRQGGIYGRYGVWVYGNGGGDGARMRKRRPTKKDGIAASLPALFGARTCFFGAD